MRPILFAAIVCVLVLAACGGTPQPTATPVPPTAVPPTVAPANVSVATMAATLGLPQPGTAIIPDQPTPNAPTPEPISFTDITFTQTGGIANLALKIDLHGDGTLIRDGKTSAVTPSDIKAINTLLDQIQFFALQGIFVGPGATSDTYTYSVTVTTADRSRTIQSQDGLTPPQLNQLYDAIRKLNNS